MLTFYDGFFLNLCVLIASLFVYEELVKKNSFEIQTISITIINGLLGGLLAAILMRFNIETSANAIIDLRIIPFMLVILYGNWLSTSITGGLIIFIRFMMGINIYSAINIIFILASWMIFCYCFKKIKSRWISIVVMLTLSNTVYTVLNAILSAGKGVNISLIATYWISCILGGLIAVYIMDYLNETKIVFKRNSKYAFTDPLTGLNNVRSFDLAFNKAKSKLEKSNESISIIVMLTLSNTVYTVLNAILSAGKGLNIFLIATYWISCILGGLTAVYIMDYLNETKIVFKRNSKYAFTDPLTGLNNVRSFDLAFNKAKRKLEKSNESISIMILDIDHFKQVNDTYGHLEGDLVLKKVAAILKMSQDPEDIISRNGGEEFSVLLNNCSHIEAYEKADALRKIMENSFFIIKNGTITIHVTISIGITTYKDKTIEIDQLYDHADQALYVAKKSGRNKVCSYSPGIDLVPT